MLYSKADLLCTTVLLNARIKCILQKKSFEYTLQMSTKNKRIHSNYCSNRFSCLIRLGLFISKFQMRKGQKVNQ